MEIKLWDKLQRTECHTRVFVAWLLISSALCFVYAIVVYASLVSKNVLPSDPGPDFVPFTNIPKRYNVTLNFENSSNHSVSDYSGLVRLAFLVRETSQRVFIQAGSAVKIKKCSLTDSFGNSIFVQKGVYNPKTEIQTLIPQGNLTSELDYFLEIEFTGRINQPGPTSFSYVSTAGDKRYGLYFSSPAGASKGLRYLFPSLDSTQFPAMIDLTIYHKDSLRALSNFASSTRTQPHNYLTDSFLASTRLYPAQVGLVLCDFPYQRQVLNGTQITIYYRADVIQKVSLRRLQQFMDKSSYTVGKLDAVVLPSATTVHLPGLSLLNEEETIAENNAINGF